MNQAEIQTDLQNDLKRFMRLHKIGTLTAVRALPIADLLKMEGFGYRMLVEIVLNKDITQL